MRSAPPLAALALAVTVLLTGCVPEAPDIDPPPEPTSESVFASDEEALAVATDAYKAYLAMSDLIAQEGGKDPERIAPFVTEEALSEQVGQFEPYRDRSLRVSGESSFDEMTLQQLTETPPSRAEIGVYLCLDVSGVKVIDESGSDVTPSNRINRIPLEVGFEMTNENPKLLMNRSETWHGTNFC